MPRTFTQLGQNKTFLERTETLLQLLRMLGKPAFKQTSPFDGNVSAKGFTHPDWNPIEPQQVQDGTKDPSINL